MIGILNCGGDQADEFYSSGRRSSLYGKIRFSRSNAEIFTKLRNAIRQQESNDKCKLEASGSEIEGSCAATYLESCA
uniref:Uncharacterized protein n=1 Tax=Parascaris equorum TaxID=6256 RepID=A0A914RWI9_PAREQ